MKKALIIIIPLAILAFILASWDNVKAAVMGKAGKKPNSGNGGQTGIETGGIISGGLNMNKLLKRGVSGSEVRELQTLINRHAACPPVAIDGIFGPQTEGALVCWLNTTQITLSQVEAGLT